MIQATECCCTTLSLRYRLRHSIPLALALSFTFKTERMNISSFVFGVQYVCHLTGKAQPEVKFFGVLGRRAGETSGLAFDYPLKGCFSYILRFPSVVYILIHRFHRMQCLYRVFTMHF